MGTDQLIRLLGLRASRAETQEALSQFGLPMSPGLDLDVPPDEQCWSNWLTSGRHGVEFGFTDEAYFQALAPSLRGKGPLLLTQVYFYCRQPGIQPYHGELPFGLESKDSRTEVRRKLRALEGRTRFHIRDVCDLPTIRIVVAYAPEDGGVASVLCMLPLRPWPVSRDEPGPPPLPEQLVRVLGQPPTSAMFHEVFAPLDLGSFGFDTIRPEEWDLRHAYGLDLSFIDPPPDTAPPFDGTPVLGSIKLYRDRELDAYGWKGELPYSLSFDDSQDVLLEKVGHPPADRRDDDLVGFALWHFPEFSLHLLYSNFENLLLRVTLMRPGLWASAVEP